VLDVRPDHGSEVDGLDKLRQEPDAHMVRIDEVTIFPDLDGLGRFLTTVLKSETDTK
jgi:hypothetical protein